MAIVTVGGSLTSSYSPHIFVVFVFLTEVLVSAVKFTQQNGVEILRENEGLRAIKKTFEPHSSTSK